MTNRISMRNYAKFMKKLDEETDAFIAEMEEKAQEKMNNVKKTIHKDMAKKIKKENFKRNVI